jgi:hypothetical protein
MKSDGLKTFWLNTHGNGSICLARAKITKADILDSPMHFEASGARKAIRRRIRGSANLFGTSRKKGMNEGNTNTTKSQNRGPVNAPPPCPVLFGRGASANSCAFSSSDKIAQY